MKSITRAFSAFAVVGTVLASSAAFAAPAQIAAKAHQNNLSAAEAIEASGKEVTPELKSSVNFFLRGLDNND